jgi:hypothetical protein
MPPTVTRALGGGWNEDEFIGVKKCDTLLALSIYHQRSIGAAVILFHTVTF